MKRTALFAMSVLVTSSAFAQAPDRGWIDVNFVSVQSQQDAQTYTWSARLFGETITAATAYPKLPRATGVAVEAGLKFHSMVGVGVHFDPVKYEYPVGLAVSVPHPLIFNRLASDADATSGTLERKDLGVDIFVTFIPRTPDAWRIRLFGGPTYFKVTQEMVEVIRYSQVFNAFGANVVDITTHTDKTVEDSAWGFNVGADLSYFFSKYVGVGGVVRFNQGTVKIASEPLTGQPTELEAGHTTVGGGLRLRF